MLTFWIRAVSRCALLLSVLLGVPAAQAWVLAINDGVSYQNSREETAARYAPLAADLAKLLQQPVSIEVVSDYAALRKGLAEKRFDLAWVHPTHVGIEAVRRNGYHLLAVVRGYQTYQAQILVDGKSGLNSVQQLKGQHLSMPDEDSITAVLVRAALREAGLSPQDLRLSYTRYQDAVPFFVENGLAHAGATASTKIAKAWTDKGGKVLAKSRAVPIKLLLASPQLSAAQQQQVREYLLKLDGSDDGRKKLDTLRLNGFDTYDEATLLSLGQWLGV
jgi:phosphonate transport system substrate-binding protein